MITQCFDFIVDTIRPKYQPVRIRVKDLDEYQQIDAQRNLRASKYKR